MSEGVQTAGSVADEAGLKFETFAAMVGKVSEKTRAEGKVWAFKYSNVLRRMYLIAGNG